MYVTNNQLWRLFVYNVVLRVQQEISSLKFEINLNEEICQCCIKSQLHSTSVE